MKRSLRALVPCLLLAAAPAALVVSCKDGAHEAAQAQRWQCAMHPQIIRDKPGDCPICGMKLVPIAHAPAGGEKPSPIPSAQGSSVPGFATVRIDPEKRRAMGLKTAAAARLSFSTSIRTVGRVTYDERLVHHVHTKYDAYVEDVPSDVNFVGAPVQRGQTLLSLYSPDLFATEQEYLLALRAKKMLGASAVPGVSRRGSDLLDSARQRLVLWDFSAADIAGLEATGKPSRTYELSAPMSGYVIGKMAVHGMKVTAADSLFDIADLSHLWVLADVYESELPRVSVGQPATVTLSYWPARSWKGSVSYVFPTVDEKTRTVKVRIDVDNPDAVLKPEMFADVVIKGKPRTAIVVPEDAVLDSGTRKIVFVALDEGVLSPRVIVTGDQSEGMVEVLSGLGEGEAVARGANFLLDSESRLKSALATFDAGRAAAPAATPSAHRHEPPR